MRTNQSTSIKKVDTATINSWNTTFTYEIVNGALVDNAIIASAQKDGVYANIALRGESQSTNFSKGTPDYQLAEAINEEFELIKSEINQD